MPLVPTGPAEARQYLLDAIGRQPMLVPYLERALNRTSSTSYVDRVLDNSLGDLFTDSAQLATLDSARASLGGDPTPRQISRALGKRAVREDVATATLAAGYLSDHRSRVTGAEALATIGAAFETAARDFADNGSDPAATIKATLDQVLAAARSAVEDLQAAYPTDRHRALGTLADMAQYQVPVPAKLSEVSASNETATSALLGAIVARGGSGGGQGGYLTRFAATVSSVHHEARRVLNWLETGRNPGAVDMLTKGLLPDLIRSVEQAIERNAPPGLVGSPLAVVDRALRAPGMAGTGADQAVAAYKPGTGTAVQPPTRSV